MYIKIEDIHITLFWSIGFYFPDDFWTKKPSKNDLYLTVVVLERKTSWGWIFFLCLIEKKRNIFSPPRRKPPAIFDQKDFAVIVHSVPKVEIIFLFKFEKKKLFCSIICSMYCRKHEFFDVFYTI